MRKVWESGSTPCRNRWPPGNHRARLTVLIAQQANFFNYLDWFVEPTLAVVILVRETTRVHHLFVAPEFHRRGVAAKLRERAKANAFASEDALPMRLSAIDSAQRGGHAGHARLSATKHGHRGAG